jgi:hypothetical protein
MRKGRAVERREAAPAHYAGEAHLGGGGDEVGTDGYFQKELRRTREKGWGGLGLNPNAVPLIFRARGHRKRLG